MRGSRVLAKRSRVGIPISFALHRSGSHTRRIPAISSRARSMAITSKTWVTPPVGSGSAGNASNRTKRTAKLFSSKTSIRLPIVFGCSLRSQPSSWSLSLSPSGIR